MVIDTHEAWRAGEPLRADRDRVQPAALLHGEPAAGALEDPDPRPRLELRLRRRPERRRDLRELPAQEAGPARPAADPHDPARRLHAARQPRSDRWRPTDSRADGREPAAPPALLAAHAAAAPRSRSSRSSGCSSPTSRPTPRCETFLTDRIDSSLDTANRPLDQPAVRAEPRTRRRSSFEDATDQAALAGGGPGCLRRGARREQRAPSWAARPAATYATAVPRLPDRISGLDAPGRRPLPHGRTPRGPGPTFRVRAEELPDGWHAAGRAAARRGGAHPAPAVPDRARGHRRGARRRDRRGSLARPHRSAAACATSRRRRRASRAAT